MGETEQYLEKRISSHRYDLNHLEKESTALAHHKKNTGHDLDLESVSIITYENNRCRRKLREVIENIGNNKSFNFKTDSEELYTFYSHVLMNS